MKPPERAVSTKALIEECYEVMAVKERDYASDTDTLANFKRIGSRLGLTKFQVWGIYFNKHADSVNNAVKYHPDNPQTETKSEPIHTRIVDLINYLTILQNMFDELK